MKYNIRYAQRDDVDAIARIHSRSFCAAYKDIIPDFILKKFTAGERQPQIAKALEENNGKYAVITDDNEPFGFLCFGRCRDKDLDDSYGEIWGLYLLPEYCRRGGGIALLEWGIGELREEGRRNASLWVIEENMNARKFYEKYGFRHDGTVKEVVLGKAMNELRYVLSISTKE